MRMRAVSAATLLLALCLLPAGIGAAMGQRSQARAALDAGLSHAAAERSAVLVDYFQRARALTLLAAHNPAFAEFYAMPGNRVTKIRSNPELMQQIDDGLGYLETLFPGSIGEACFIDRSGAEVARTVRGIRATLPALSLDESKNPFFAPTFAMPVGSVYQARPYVSQDTHEWVISNSTPLSTLDGSAPAILHFEVTVESFRAAAGVGAGAYASTSSTRRRVRWSSTAAGRRGSAHRWAAPATRASRPSPGQAGSGRMDVDGRPAAFQRLTAEAGNANDWIVVAVAPVPVGLLYGIGPMAVGLVVAALGLLALAGTFDLVARRELVSAAMTDALTGLGNRRMLLRDLGAQLRGASPENPLVLVLFDLNGFKSYNDAFGHSAGDDLLARLGRALAAAVGARGCAYRLGGDEFCVLARLGTEGVEALVAATREALTEHGSGFLVDPSFGVILLPSETDDVVEALRMVDQRMYAHKRTNRRSADRQSKDVLLHALHERDPHLRARLGEAARLVEQVAERMGLSPEDTERAVQAAELRHIGQVAIPDAILDKADDELEPEEQAFLANLPLISERIIAAAPALTPVARLVRSSHEHVDGSGHPDGLTGDAIPLASRIVAACDRYVVLAQANASRPDPTVAAMASLRREAGGHVDVDVVEALTAVLAPGTGRHLVRQHP